MTPTPPIKYRCRTYTDKVYTSMMWSLEDWSLLSYTWTSIVSPTIVLHGMNEKTCQFSFKLAIDNRSTLVPITFSKPIEYHTMKISLSLIDENLRKRVTSEQLYRDSQQDCSLSFDFVLMEASESYIMDNDTLTWLFEVTIVKSVEVCRLQTVFGKPDLATLFRDNLKSLLDNKHLCDVTLVVGQNKFYAHRAILAANSQVFAAMFNTNNEDLTNGTVEIPDIDPNVFEAFLCSMYTGEVEELHNIVDKLIVVADKYQVIDLKRICEIYLSSSINNDTAITYLLIAHSLSCKMLEEACIDFIKINIHILKDPSVLVTLSEYPSIVSQIFDKKNDELLEESVHVNTSPKKKYPWYIGPSAIR